ncbi:CocE/NonD family hydrolase [Sphingomonas oligophenolica]|uniref:CocE/NonD family hydrolase n=1 Tax=Sphingomonas oligophenolica TaxID=301154 RepID=A0ABU9Y175_9SPHN
MSFTLRSNLFACGGMVALGIAAMGNQAARAQAPAPDAPPSISRAVRPATAASVLKRSTYVAMPDGTRLAVDIYLPEGYATGPRLPAILEQTRYYRSQAIGADPVKSCKIVAPHYAFFALRGYAVIVADVRGTGASYGTRPAEFSDPEVEDGSRLVDWIAAQPWSNGSVGADGISYVGTTSEMLLRNHNPKVKAVAPISGGYDFYADLDFPGGARNKFFIGGWGAFNKALDAGHPEAIPVLAQLGWHGPCPVDGDEDGKQVAAAIGEHQHNLDSAAELRAVKFRDDAWASGAAAWPDPARYRRSIDELQTPLLAIAGWYDSGYANAAIERFRNTTSRQQWLVIPSANHGVRAFYAPSVTGPMPANFDADAEVLRFFDHYVAGMDNGYEREPRVRWFTSGIDTWQSSSTWPQPTKTMTLCFSPTRTLETRPCAGAGTIDYVPTADAQTGDNTRWNTTLGGAPVYYGDRATVDRQLLAFTGQALTSPASVTGHPVVTLDLKNTTADADYFVYLEEVKPSGAAFYVTEGVLRASHSAIGPVGYASTLPTHSDLAADQLTDTANRRIKLAIRLQPTSHVFARGSRIRLVIAGTDRAHFDSPSLEGQHWTIRVGRAGSQLQLPLATGTGG